MMFSILIRPEAAECAREHLHMAFAAAADGDGAGAAGHNFYRTMATMKTYGGLKSKQVPSASMY